MKVNYESSLENIKVEDTLAYQNLRFNTTFIEKSDTSLFYLIEFKLP